MKKLMTILVLICTFAIQMNAQDIPELKRGANKFEYHCNGAFAGITINVYYYVPARGDIKDMKVQFVMHGVNRNADDYRDSWIDKANQYGIIILAPQFDKENFPTKKYQHGNVKNRGAINKTSAMTYSIIDDIFSALVQKNQLRNTKYNLYGHSAGAQFVHRFVMFYPSPYLDIAIAANSGTYTFPQDDYDYPFGFSGIGGVSKMKEEAFNKRLTILLAEGDTIRDSNLNVTAEADLQGLNRWERGNNFFKTSKSYADKRRFPFSWQLKSMSGAAHSNSKMSKFAADLLYR